MLHHLGWILPAATAAIIGWSILSDYSHEWRDEEKQNHKDDTKST